MARHATRKEKALAEKLRREIDSRPARGLDAVIGRPEPHGNLLAGLRNVNRTTTRALDEAGVPDELQGKTEAEKEAMRDAADEFDDEFWRDWHASKDW